MQISLDREKREKNICEFYRISRSVLDEWMALGIDYEVYSSTTNTNTYVLKHQFLFLEVRSFGEFW